MQKLFTLLAAVGLVTSLCGITHNNSAASAQSGRRLTVAEMYGTRGNGYTCNVPICNRPSTNPGCQQTRNNIAPYTNSSYNPGFGVGSIAGGGPYPHTTTIWCSVTKYYSDPLCQTYVSSEPTTYAAFCSGGV